MRGKVLHKWDSTRKGRLFGAAFALGTVIPAGFLAVWAAFTIFNVPIQGGGSIVTAAEKLHFLAFGVSIAAIARGVLVSLPVPWSTDLPVVLFTQVDCRPHARHVHAVLGVA